MFRFLWALSGFAIAGGLAAILYFQTPHYSVPLSGEARLYLQSAYPGGNFKNIYEYRNCQIVFWPDGPSVGSAKGNYWVLYKQGGDLEVTGQTCWIVPKSPNQE